MLTKAGFDVFDVADMIQRCVHTVKYCFCFVVLLM